MCADRRLCDVVDVERVSKRLFKVTVRQSEMEYENQQLHW